MFITSPHYANTHRSIAASSSPASAAWGRRGGLIGDSTSSAARRFARLREVAPIAVGFEVMSFARIDPVSRRAGRKFESGAAIAKIPCFAREIPGSGATGICSQAFELSAGFLARNRARGDSAKSSLQIPVEQGISPGSPRVDTGEPFSFRGAAAEEPRVTPTRSSGLW
jgi:hypothetical protein